jgi:hypothetical protein
MSDDGLSHEDRMTLRLFGQVDLDDDEAVERRMLDVCFGLTAVLVVFCWQNGLMDYSPVIVIGVLALPCVLLGWARYRDHSGQ